MFDWHLFNYTDFNKINLDWIMDCLKALWGGSTDQILSKKSDNDFDFEWVNKPEVTPGTGLTEEIKQALLQLAQKVAYIDNQGQTYYQDLYNALYGTTPIVTLESINAVYTQSGTVYDTDTLNSLKADLVVAATYSDSITAIIPGAEYTLTGTLTVGSSVITVSYGGKTDTFTVTVTESPPPPVTLVSIDAVYTQSGTVYDTDTLDSLKADLVVTATYSDSTTAIIPAADYTLSGTLAVGSSVVTVTYEGKTDTFTVTVTDSTATLVSIDAVYTQSGTVYDNANLNTLKSDLVVTAAYSDSTTAVVPSSDYTLSGTLSAGTSTITVSYMGMTDTFQVTVTATVILYNWDFKTSLTDSVGNQTAVLDGATRDSSGLHFTGALHNVLCGTNIVARDRTIEIDFGTMDSKFNSAAVNGIFFWINETPTHGFGWAANKNAFGGYWNTAWNTIANVSNLNYFSGSTFKMTISSGGNPTYYKDGMQIGGSTTLNNRVQTADKALLLGSTTSDYPAFYDMVIEAVRIYEGVV